MNVKDEKTKLSDMKYLLDEINQRNEVINELNTNKNNLFSRFFKFFKLKTEQNKTLCSDGYSYHLDIDSELKKDVILAFEKSRDRLVNIYNKDFKL